MTFYHAAVVDPSSLRGILAIAFLAVGGIAAGLITYPIFERIDIGERYGGIKFLAFMAGLVGFAALWSYMFVLIISLP